MPMRFRNRSCFWNFSPRF